MRDSVADLTFRGYTFSKKFAIFLTRRQTVSLPVECYGRHGCEVIVEGVSADDAEKLKAACSVMETGYLRIVSLPFACAKISFPFTISFDRLDDFTDFWPVR